MGNIEHMAKPQSVSSLNTVSVLLDKTGTIEQLQFSPPNLLPASAEKLIGKNWFDCCIPEHARQPALTAFQKLFEDDAFLLLSEPCPVVTREQKEALLSWHSLPRLDQQHSVSGVWLSGVSYQDHSHQRNIDIALQRSRLNAQVVLDNAVEAIITISARGIIESFNRAAESMFGYTTSEIIGEKINKLMPTPHQELHDSYITNYISTGQKKIIGIGREVSGLRKDGSQFPIELSVSEVFIDGERSFTGIIRDISDRKNAERELQQRDNELKQIRDRIAHMDRLNVMGEMATGIAHELNQPLTAIATYAQASRHLLDTAIKSNDDLSHALHQINEQAQRAGEVIRRLRSMVTKQRQPYEWININHLIEESIELAKTDSRLKDIIITTQFDPSLPDIQIDSIQIQQVVLNLIRNAIDALEDIKQIDKQITLSTSMQGSAVQVTIIDNGSGIKNTDKNEIFNPFFSTKNHGMGMGLAICRSIINSHGGELTVNSNNLKETELHFTLPTGTF